MIARVETQGGSWTSYGLFKANSNAVLEPVMLHHRNVYDPNVALPFSNSSLKWRFREDGITPSGEPMGIPDFVYATGPVSSHASSMTSYMFDKSSGGRNTVTNGFRAQFYDTSIGVLYELFSPKSYTGTLLRQINKPVYPKGGIDYSTIDYYHSLTVNSGTIDSTFCPSFVYLENPGYDTQLYGRYYCYTLSMVLSFKGARVASLSDLDIVLPVASSEAADIASQLQIQKRNVFGYSDPSDILPEFYHSKDGSNSVVTWKMRATPDYKTIIVVCSAFYWHNHWCTTYLNGSGAFMAPIITFKPNSLVWDSDTTQMEINETHIETVEGWSDVI